jgi:hypothetical protein
MVNDLPIHLRAIHGLSRFIGVLVRSGVRRLRPMGEGQMFLRSCGLAVERLDDRA